MKAGIANIKVLFIALAGLLILGHSNQAKSEEILLKLPSDVTSGYLNNESSGVMEPGSKFALTMRDALIHQARVIDRLRYDNRFNNVGTNAVLEYEKKTYLDLVSKVKAKFYSVFDGTGIDGDSVILQNGDTPKSMFSKLESIAGPETSGRVTKYDSSKIVTSAIGNIRASSLSGVDISKSRTQRTPFRVVNGRSNASVVKAEMTLSRAIDSARRNRGNGPIYLSIAAGVIVSGAANAGEAEPVELAGDSKPTFDRSWARPKSQRVSN